nr:MAG TPA: hypothetical protein [Caudoviricetes sp.]
MSGLLFCLQKAFDTRIVFSYISWESTKRNIP